MTDSEHTGLSLKTGEGKSAVAVAAVEGLMETWKPIPGAGHYEASDRGHIRSVDRTIGGRFYKGVVLKPREDPDGYLRVNITDDNRERKHNESVARLVLLAHDPDGYFPGAVACHEPGRRRDDCRLAALRWDTEEKNREEALAVRLENSPPKPKPPKVCVRCGAEHDRKGRNCLGCMVEIGQNVARYLTEGMPLDKAADAVDYPPAGAFGLAVRYGGLRVSIKPQSVSMGRGEGKSAPIEIMPLAPHAVGYRESLPSWLRRVLFRRGPSRQNSDGA